MEEWEDMAETMEHGRDDGEWEDMFFSICTKARQLLQ
jgi:hypothetical protein